MTPWLCRTITIAAALFLVLPPRAPSQPPPRRVTLDALRERCIELSEVKQGSDYQECRVTAVGDVGVVDGRRYHYAIYCLVPAGRPPENGGCVGDSFNASYYPARGVLVLAADSARGDLELMFERVPAEIGMYVYRPPTIVRNDGRVLLYLPIAMDGTGNYNKSEYYVRENGQWERLESEAWIADLRAQLPPHLAAWKGIWPDPATLRADAGLYRRGDGNCCPTGGIARIQLGIRDRRFVLLDVAIDRKSP